jgi:hypothetical protein
MLKEKNQTSMEAYVSYTEDLQDNIIYLTNDLYLPNQSILLYFAKEMHCTQDKQSKRAKHIRVLIVTPLCLCVYVCVCLCVYVCCVL